MKSKCQIPNTRMKMPKLVRQNPNAKIQNVQWDLIRKVKIVHLDHHAYRYVQCYGRQGFLDLAAINTNRPLKTTILFR